MRVGSLFSGIGGIELGLARVGFETAWQVEIDSFCQRVLSKHWPDTPRFGDISRVSGDELTAVDIIVGGFPCQDISIAGWSEGILEGTRSGLWFEMFRLVKETLPRYVLIENVPEIRRGRLLTVLADLATIRYDAEWYSVPASFVGAPHKRERVFILAYPNSEWVETKNPRPRLLTKTSGDSEFSWNAGRAAIVGRSHWGDQPRVSGVDDGIPNHLDRVRTLGNACVPHVARFIGTQLLDWEYY